MRRVALLSVYVALAIVAVVLVTGDDTKSTGDATQSTSDVTQSTGDDARPHAEPLAAEDLVRNFRNQSNRNVRGTRVRCRAADKGEWLCSYVVGGKTCTGEISGTPDDPEVNLFCGSKGS